MSPICREGERACEAELGAAIEADLEAEEDVR
jgi:hypothetical protein